MLVTITAPTGEAVTVDRAKQRLRIDGTSNDADLEALIEAATQAVESETGLTLRATGFELRLDCWPDWQPRWYDRIKLPAAPVREVDEVVYLDEDLAEQMIDAGEYYWERSREGANLYFVEDYSRPVLGRRPDALKIRFTAGFDDPAESGSGDDPELAFPERAEMAILFLVGHWHQTRESVQAGQHYEVPDTFKYLANQLRVFR